MPMATNNGYRAILLLLREAGKALDGGAVIAAVSMVYVGIDTMTWLALPVGEEKQNGAAFRAWVDTYLKADQASPYQYDGRDVWAARCAVLHQFGAVADLHRKDNPPKKFGYLDTGSHQTDGGELILISAAMLLRDFGNALRDFLTAARTNADLKARIDSRALQLLADTPIQYTGHGVRNG